MKRFLAGCGLLLMVACAGNKAAQKPVEKAGPAGPPPKLIEIPPAVSYKEGRELMARGDWDAAKTKVETYLGREQKNAAAWFDFGWIAEKRTDLATAQDAYKKTLALDPAHLGAAVNLSRLLRDKPAEAEPVLRGSLAKHQGDPALLNALASTLRAQKKLDEAAKVVRQVLERHPKDADAYRNLAAIEADRGHVRLAESALQNARKLDDKDAGILNSLGLLAMRRDDVATARGYFDEATKLDPKLPAAWANLGAIALQYRDYPLAEQCYAKAVGMDGDRWQTRLAHGWALEGLRKFKDARGEYEKTLALRPQQEDALYGRAVALKAEGDLPAAMEAFKAYMALGKPAHEKEAQGQIAAIDLRLKNPPAQLKPGLQEKKEHMASGAEIDLSKLPQGADTGAPAEKLPTEMPVEAPGDGVKTEPKPAEKPVDPKGTEKKPEGAVQARVVQ